MRGPVIQRRDGSAAFGALENEHEKLHGPELLVEHRLDGTIGTGALRIIYRFLNVELDCAGYRIYRGGHPVRIEPLVLELTIYLIGQRNRMVPKKELLERVWNNQFVAPSVLPRAVCLARRAIDSRESIRTVHGRGYQWITPVETNTAHPTRSLFMSSGDPCESAGGQEGEA